MRRVNIRNIVTNTKILGYKQELEVVRDGKTLGWFLPKFPSLSKVIELHGGKLSLPATEIKNETYKTPHQKQQVFLPVCPTHGIYNKTCGCG